MAQVNQMLFDPPKVPHVLLDAVFTDKMALHFEVTKALSTLAQRRDRSMRLTLTVIENQPGCVTDNDETRNVVPSIPLLPRSET